MSVLLTAEDYWAASHAIHDRVLDMQRTLALMGKYCPPGYRQELNAAITAEIARETRFQQAAMFSESTGGAP